MKIDIFIIKENEINILFYFPILFSLKMVALVVGVIFYGQELTQDGVMNINGAIFLFLTNMTFQNVFSVANVSFNKKNTTF